MNAVRSLRLLAALALATVTVVGTGWLQAASAHAALVGTDPEKGARLDAVPARVNLTFSEDMSAPAYIVVTAPDGARIAKGEVKVDGPEVGVALEDVAQSGAYTVAFRAVSADGHPVTGQYSFTVAGGASSPAAGAGDASSPASSASPSASPSAGSSQEASEASVASTSDGDDGSNLGEVQVGVGVALFAAAGGLFWFSRRKHG